MDDCISWDSLWVGKKYSGLRFLSDFFILGSCGRSFKLLKRFLHGKSQKKKKKFFLQNFLGGPSFKGLLGNQRQEFFFSALGKRLLMKIPGNQSIFCLWPIQKNLHLGIPDGGTQPYRSYQQSMGEVPFIWL